MFIHSIFQDQSAENEDYNREDLEHVENMLYANIHYDTGYVEQQNSSTDHVQDNQGASNSFTNTKSTASDRKTNASRRSAKRYWNNGTSNFVPFFKEKHSGIYKATPVVAGESNNEALENAKNVKNNQPSESIEATTVKQFTPYVSFLPLNDSTTNAMEEPIPTATRNESNQKLLKTTNEEVRKNLTSKHINPFSKKHAIDTYKTVIDEEPNEIGSSSIQHAENKKRLNPFNPLSRKAKKKKMENNQSKSVRKNRELLKHVAAITAKVAPVSVANISVIDVDSDNEDDDDVIILPTQEPPLICVDSSDDETTAKNMNEHEFTEPNAVDARRKVPRSSSPSSSIQSADDFIVQNDQHSFGFDTFGTLSDEDLCHVSETVENEMRDKDAPSTSKKSTITNVNDNAIFTPPKQMQMQKEKSKSSASTAKRSYEVGANSFTAVDVYESESSDMPDSIYAKGDARKRKTVSDSDSSVESVAIVKSKRLKKRKSSLSVKESDHMHSDDSSSDLPEDDDEDDDDDDVDDEAPNEISYLVRGEALGKVKNGNGKKSKKNRNSNEKRSENDFMNKLSNIVYGGNDSDDNGENESPLETSAESIGARDIVESVLQRRTKRLKKDPPAQVESSNQTEPDPSDASDAINSWAITDQVGETDELNLGTISDNNALDASSNADGVQNEDDCPQENPPQNAITEEPAAPTTESNETNQPNEQNLSNAENSMQQETPCDNEDDVFDGEIGWNEEMKRFYHNSWGGETFSLRNIRSRMPSKLNYRIFFEKQMAFRRTHNLFPFDLIFRRFSELDDYKQG